MKCYCEWSHAILEPVLETDLFTTLAAGLDPGVEMTEPVILNLERRSGETPRREVEEFVWQQGAECRNDTLRLIHA